MPTDLRLGAAMLIGHFQPSGCGHPDGCLRPFLVAEGRASTNHIHTDGTSVGGPLGRPPRAVLNGGSGAVAVAPTRYRHPCRSDRHGRLHRQLDIIRATLRKRRIRPRTNPRCLASETVASRSGGHRWAPRTGSIVGCVDTEASPVEPQMLDATLEWRRRNPRPATSRVRTFPRGGRPPDKRAVSDFEQPALERVPHELRARVQPQLLLDVGAVGLNRSHRQVELTRDLGVRVPQGDQAQNVDLAL